MEDEKKIMIRLPESTVKELEKMVAKGIYANLSEAIRDCVGKYLDSNPVVNDKTKEYSQSVKMEDLVKEELSMDELIRKTAKKYTKDHL